MVTASLLQSSLFSESEYDLDVDVSVQNTSLQLAKKNATTSMPKTTSIPKKTTKMVTTASSKLTTTTRPKITTSTSSPTKAPKSECAPLPKADGTKDCDKGMRILPNGKRQTCKPVKKDCEKQNEKGKPDEKSGKAKRDDKPSRQ